MAGSSSQHSHFQLLILTVFFLLSNFYCCCNFFTFAAASSATDDDTTTTRVYIVYMNGKQQENPATIVRSHHDMLATLLGSKEAAKDSILYSYKHGFSGFAASLTDSQARAIADMPGVVLVFPNRILEVHTTRSWDFLGLSPPSPSGSNLLSETNMGDGTIIGVIDTGIWPESQSFSDDGMGPIPGHWKGTCQTGQSFYKSNCNRKIIGARWFRKGYEAMYHRPINTTLEYLSPRDKSGHGTHTASIAAGRFVSNASYGGLGRGIARGGAPLARLAIYKVAWFEQSTDADIMKAFDMAIHDGVDILSVSLGFSGELPRPSYFKDGIAVGSFHAVEKGITVVSSAGNNGPSSDTVGNTAPWIITVAATTFDRDFQTTITLGNNHPSSLGHTLAVEGQPNEEIVITGSGKKKSPTVDGDSFAFLGVTADGDSTRDDACTKGSLDATLIKGKYVLCFLQPSSQRSSVEIAEAVREAGGIGVIYTRVHNDVLDPCVIPCLKVDFETGTNTYFYIQSTRSPTISHTPAMTVLGQNVAPFVASLSCRGPSTLSPDVLKPDIAAPGVNILAAYPPPLTGHPYEILSGTSMACPHVAGVAALLKTLHRDWSPAAIKSAIMTTARLFGTDAQPIMAQGGNIKAATPFDMGAGSIDPTKVADPGLIFDITPNNYIQYLCSLNVTDEQMFNLTGSNDSCSSSKRQISRLDLNLPSISVPYLEDTVAVTRFVTNVGPVNSVYKAIVKAPPGIAVEVKPRTLTFTATTKVLNFRVTFKSTQKLLLTDYSFGSLTWTDKKHLVTIPVAVRVAHQYSIPM